MKRIALVAALAGMLFAGPARAHNQLRLVGSMALHFQDRPSAGEAIDAFGRTDQEFFYGPGWEVVLDHVGIGGNYLVRFFEDEAQARWVDWVSEAFFVSYHLLGAGRTLDPFIHAGLGTAGRSLANEHGHDADPVYVSVFPMLVAGLGLDLDGFLLGGRFTYIPEVSPPPGTDLESYPLERFQVAFYGGIAIGGRETRHPHRRTLHVHWE